MTRKEAIKYLKIDINLSNRRTCVDSELILTNEEFKEALQMAIEALDRPHGEWVTVRGSNGKDYRKCTNCLHTQEITGLLNYCPICGADMRGDEE